MNLEQLTNDELLSKFDEMDLPKNTFSSDWDYTISNAYSDLLVLPGVQDNADNSRQTIIDFLRYEQQMQPPQKTRRVGGRKRKTIKRRRNKKDKKSKRRKS